MFQIKDLRNENRICKCQEKAAKQSWMADSTSEMRGSKVERQEADIVITDGPAASATSEGAEGNITFFTVVFFLMWKVINVWVN